MSLIIEPNPTVISRTGHIHNTGTVTAKYTGQNKCLFSLEFDTEIFCSISPACGEIEGGKSREFKFSFEDTIRGNEELSFLIRYVSVENDANPDMEARLMSAPKEWQNSEKAVIKFSSHAEDALKAVAFSIKSKPSLAQVISRSESRDIDAEQREMLERKIVEKRAQREQLKRKVKNFHTMISDEEKSLKELMEKPNTESQMIYFGFFLVVFALFVKLFKK